MISTIPIEALRLAACTLCSAPQGSDGEGSSRYSPSSHGREHSSSTTSSMSCATRVQPNIEKGLRNVGKPAALSFSTYWDRLCKQALPWALGPFPLSKLAATKHSLTHQNQEDATFVRNTMPQHEYMEAHKKRHGERMDRAEKR